jgi:2',3'-cyclic-nucleotide 2'-phosphodiesterase/3'-nucleotidase/5'-nucleotidase
MRFVIASAFSVLGSIAVAAPSAPAPTATLSVLGTYRTHVFEQGAAEIVAFDAATKRIFVVNAAATTVDVLDASHPDSPQLLATIDASALGGSANSVAVKDGLVAVAIQDEVKTNPGLVAVYDTATLALRATFAAGALPDMLTFTPDGKAILVANEGEPNDDYSVDPEGSVTHIDLSSGLDAAVVTQIGFTKWNGKEDKLRALGVRIYGPGATTAQDLEPEYIAVSADSRTAWVTLQENNAFARIDLPGRIVEGFLPLGTKDHSLAANAFDASDRDARVNVAAWPVRGLYLPDSVAAYTANDKTFLVTANEGDTRDYDTFAEEARVRDLTLDPVVFPNRAALRDVTALGRLNVTNTLGDVDGDGDYDALYSFGGRSFSIWNGDGRLIYDSGSEIERRIAEVAPASFNSDHAANGTFDSRSDNKGPEPEGVAVGEHAGRVYAFIGLERQSGILVYDITDPEKVQFQHYLANRDFSVPTRLADGSTNPAAGDLGPEGLTFVSAANSPTSKPLLIVGNEVSGTTTLYQLDVQ